jgi:hypothetical protein
LGSGVLKEMAPHWQEAFIFSFGARYDGGTEEVKRIRGLWERGEREGGRGWC